MTPDQNAAIALMHKAEIALHEAEAGVEEQLWETAVNRSYYAAFRAASALLATRGLSFSKHGAVIAEFNRIFVHGGVVAKHLGRDLNRLFELRQQADYDYQREVNRRMAGEALKKARDVVGEARRVLAEANA